jgi:large subunit ribosomal protein L24e
MPRCSFCKRNYEFPRGLTLVLNDGNILYFCKSKCRKNMLHLKRDSKKVNWIRKAPVEVAAVSENSAN